MARLSPFARTFLVLAGPALLGPLAIDVSLPAFEAMVRGLGTDAAAIQMTIGAVATGMAIGQLAFGPLADRFGRHPIMNIALLMFTVTAALIPLMESVIPVIALRFVQGLGISGTMIVSRAIVRDQFDVETSTKMFAYLFFILGFVPVIGPPVAGVLTETLGWQSVFVLMAAVCAAAWIAVAMSLRETLAAPDPKALNLSALVAASREILRDRTFLTYLAVGTGAYVCLFSVLTGLAPVMMGYLSEPPRVFGLEFAIVMFSNLAGAAVAGRLVGVLGMHRLAMLGAAVMAIGGSCFLILATLGMMGRVAILAPAAFSMIGFGLINPVLIAGALTNFKHMAGRATALAGFLFIGAGSTTAFLLGVFDNGTPIPLAIALCIGGFWSLSAYASLLHRLEPAAKGAP